MKYILFFAATFLLRSVHAQTPAITNDFIPQLPGRLSGAVLTAEGIPAALALAQQTNALAARSSSPATTRPLPGIFSQRYGYAATAWVGGSHLKLPAPAPVATDSTLASAFSGSGVNGSWKLFILDDVAGPCSTHAAEIDSWSVTLTP